MDFDGRLAQTNGRLKAARTGVSVGAQGKRLYLRATFPPRSGSHKTQPYQQRLFLGYHANPAGLKLAEQEARKIGALLDCGEFSWEPYQQNRSNLPQAALTVADWITKFEKDYFTRRKRTPKSETTWKDDYQKVFRRLEQDQALTVELLEQAIISTSPDTRNRKRFVDVLSRLAAFAQLDADFSRLKGSYSSKDAEPRDLPNDGIIAQWWASIPNSSWQWAYGMMATYGLRNHELFYLDLSKMPVLVVLDDTKTGFRRVYPLYPEWVEQWHLDQAKVPDCTGKRNSDLGNRVTHAFARYKLPFCPYDLRHAWAVRSLEFGMPVELAAQQMGHSVDVHCRTYHRWISEEVHERAFRVMMQRSDRPLPPSGKR